MLSKETGLTILGVCVVYDWLYVARILRPAGSKQHQTEQSPPLQQTPPLQQHQHAVREKAGSVLPPDAQREQPASEATAAAAAAAAAAAPSTIARTWRRACLHALLRTALAVAAVAACLVGRSVLTGTSFSPTFSNVDNHIHYGATRLIRCAKACTRTRNA
ncbi:MAG: hypothetical protein ACK4ZJ_19025, partial [Allorhizobium sp.]